MLSNVKRIASSLNSSEASQILEFALTLPLLMVFVVAIGDFGGAITLKHKLNNAVREGARFGANEPTADLYGNAGTSPPSVNAVAHLVGSYLQSVRINDCGLASGTLPTPTHPRPLAWTYTFNTTGCSVSLTVDRGFPIPAGTSGGGGVPRWVISTQVTISYPYTWQFNRVIGLIAPGASYAGPAQLLSDATIPNFM